MKMFALIFVFKIVMSINFNGLDLEEYNFPEYPTKYAKDDMYYTIVNISTRSFNYSSLTFSFYEDSECFVSAEFTPSDGNTSYSDYCISIGQCDKINASDPLGESFQIWAMAYNKKGSSAMIWVDYFDFFGKCDYNSNDFLSSNMSGVIVNKTGGSLDSRDVIQLGSCTKSKKLFQVDGQPLYFRVYYGCKDKESFEVFVLEQKNSLILGGLIVGGILVAAIAIVVLFSCSQLFFLSVVDFIFMTQKLEKKIKSKIKKKTESDNEDLKVEQPTTFKEKIKNLSVYKAFFTSENLGIDFENVLPKEKKPFLKRMLKVFIDTIMSLIILVVLEVTRAFSLWFSIICFLRSDVSNNTPFYIQDNTIYTNYQNILLVVFLIYVIVEVLFLLYWLRQHISNPAKVIVIYPCYQEWLVYRVFMVIVYFFYIFYGVQAFFDTNEDYNAEYVGILRNIFEKGNFWSDIFFYFDLATSGDFWTVLFFYLKFGSSTFFLVLDLIKVLFYDGNSSINFFHRIQACSIGCGYPFVKDYFPSVGYGLNWIGISPDVLLHRLITILSLIKELDACDIEDIDENKEAAIRKEIMILSNSMDYGNLPWSMVKKMKGKELKLLKSYIFCVGGESGENGKQVERDEEQFWDLLMYTPPVKPHWWRAVFFHACIQYRTLRRTERTVFTQEQITIDKEEKEIEMEKKEIQGEAEKDKKEMDEETETINEMETDEENKEK